MLKKVAYRCLQDRWGSDHGELRYVGLNKRETADSTQLDWTELERKRGPEKSTICRVRHRLERASSKSRASAMGTLCMPPRREEKKNAEPLQLTIVKQAQK